MTRPPHLRPHQKVDLDFEDIPVPPTDAIRRLVGRYLWRQGYTATANALELDTARMVESSAEASAHSETDDSVVHTADDRAKLRAWITSGEYEVALDHLKRCYPSVVERPHECVRALKTQIFMKMVRKKETLQVRPRLPPPPATSNQQPVGAVVQQ